MKIEILSVLLLGCCILRANAQITEKQLKPFLNGLRLVEASGDGLKQSSGDILLELASKEPDDNQTLILFRNEKGKLKKIAENRDLLMNKDMLGVSGGNYPELSGNKLSVDYTLGSNSAQSDVSIVFEKGSNGNYYFKAYTSISRNYGVENLFARKKITAQQTGKISFEKASESKIFESSKINPHPHDTDEPVYKASQRYSKYIPQGSQLATFAEGDLNLDEFKNDLLLVLSNEESCRIQLLLQQKDGSYKKAQTNTKLITPDDTFNVNNLKAVIKNGYFTIERRIATDEVNFDHRYSTFKYDTAQKNWLLYRYDVVHFSGFNPKPNVTHLRQQDFGKNSFEKLDHTPGDYFYEPRLSTLSGTLVQKQFYSRPNYGQTPEKDEKVMVYILKTDYPINVLPATSDQAPETGDKPVKDIQEIQVYTNGNKIDFKKLEGRKVKLQGSLQHDLNGNHYTKVLMKVESVTN
jgi:hypothetical protein